MAVSNLTVTEDVKAVVASVAEDLVDQVWAETQRDYAVSPLTALQITSKIVNAAWSGIVKDYVDTLSEPLQAKQTRLPDL